MPGAVTRIVPILLCLWPGLARLWLQGSGSALIVSLISAAALNAALIVTFIWPEVGGRELPSWFIPGTAWMLVLCLWGGGVLESRQMFLSWSTPPLDRESDQLFRQAQAEYLRANWVAAEKLLTTLIARRPADVEGKLLLATVLRRARRVIDARKCLQELSEIPAAGRWHREITAEMNLLAETTEKQPEAEVKSAAVDTPEVETAPNHSPSTASSTYSPPKQTKQDRTHDKDDEIAVIAFDRVERERRRRAA